MKRKRTHYTKDNRQRTCTEHRLTKEEAVTFAEMIGGEILDAIAVAYEKAYTGTANGFPDSPELSCGRCLADLTKEHAACEKYEVDETADEDTKSLQKAFLQMSRLNRDLITGFCSESWARGVADARYRQETMKRYESLPESQKCPEFVISDTENMMSAYGTWLAEKVIGRRLTRYECTENTVDCKRMGDVPESLILHTYAKDKNGKLSEKPYRITKRVLVMTFALAYMDALTGHTKEETKRLNKAVYGE